MGFIKSGSIILILAGIVIILKPEIVAYIIAIILILIGLGGMGFGVNVPRSFKAKVINKK